MKISIYADENFPRRTILELRSLGYNVLTAYEDKKANLGIDDIDVLARATELNRAVITHNKLDFKKLHFKNPNHAGIIICSEDFDRREQAQRINDKIFEFESIKGALIRVYRPNK